MLVVVVGEIALALRLAHTGKPVGRGELGHDEAAAGLLVGYLGIHRGVGIGGRREEAGVANEAPEDRIRDPGHRGEDSRRTHLNRADREAGRYPGRGSLAWGGVGALRIVDPVLLHRCIRVWISVCK